MSRLKKLVKKNTKSIQHAVLPMTIGMDKVGSLLGKKPGAADPGLDKEAQYAQMIQEINAASPADQARIMKEAEEQKTLGTGYANDHASRRKAMLNDLSGLLVNQQNQQLQQNIPDIAEQANLKGIFRSTGTGNAIAKEAGRLASNTSSELAKQGIMYGDENINDMKGVNQGYLDGRYSAMSRGFSLEDMARQAGIAKTTGQLLQPAPVKTPSAKGNGALQGALGGAATGATVGGPWGAAIGGAAGAVGGGKLASK